MGMKDNRSLLKFTNVSSPKAAVTDNTAFVSSIVDTKDFESNTFVISTGSLADSDATFTVLIEDGDNASLTDNAAVADANLIGTEAKASFTFAADNSQRSIGYTGTKRYIRATITPANNSGDIYISMLAVQGHSRSETVANTET